MNDQRHFLLLRMFFDDARQTFRDFFKARTPGGRDTMLTTKIRHSYNKATVFLGEGRYLFVPHGTMVRIAMDKQDFVLRFRTLGLSDHKLYIICLLGLWFE